MKLRPHSASLSLEDKWQTRTLENAFIHSLCLPIFSSPMPDFTSQLEHGLAFGIPKFYIASYDKINHGLVNLSSNCDVKSGPRLTKKS